MPVLVDGHNLIGKIPGLKLDDPEDEYKLVLLLRRYATRKRGRRVVVVFDRGIYGHPQNLNGYGVECIFAKSPRDADSEIAKRISNIRRSSDWMVVSSDRAVSGNARAKRIKVQSSEDFARKLLVRSTATATLDEKGSDRKLSDREIDEWLRLFGIDPDTTVDDDEDDMDLMWMY